MEAAGGGGGLGTMRALLAILQWWGFNVTVIIINKWIFQVPRSPISHLIDAISLQFPSNHAQITSLYKLLFEEQFVH
jgi:hypothetical protein